LIKHKKKNSIFIFQITESAIKVIKCLLTGGSKREFVGLELETIASDIDDRKLSEKINKIFKKLEYNLNPVIVSLPRSHVTCRYLKVPAQIPQEIEKIASLQASRYLPYPAEELNCGFQIIQADKEGYSEINLVIVHKSAIERYVNIFKELKTPKPTAVLSCCGLCNLYHYLRPQKDGPVMILDVDSKQVELAITSQEKLLFSRYFKITNSSPNWQNIFIDEINKTREVYLKEVAKEPPDKIIIFNTGKNFRGLAGILKQQMNLSAEELSYSEKINIPKELLNRISSSDYSFASLMGLCLEDVSDYLNVLPLEVKEAAKSVSRRRELLRTILYILGTIFILSLGLARNLDNKKLYLKRLKTELNKIAQDGQPLEEMERSLRFLEKHLEQKTSSLEALYEVHQIMPQELSLSNFSYEADRGIILRGQTQELNSVLNFVSGLKKSLVFKDLDIKVKYATKRKTTSGAVIDFEIVILKD